MTDRRKQPAQTGDNRVALTGAVLLLSFGAAAALETALPAGLGLSFALWQALGARQAAPAPVPARAQRGRRGRS